MTPESAIPASSLRNIETITIAESNQPLFVPRGALAPGGQPGGAFSRYSREAAKIGRRAEEIVYRYLKDNAKKMAAKEIRWIAREGLTPGWDLQYVDANGLLNAVEVKGTTGPLFGSVDITIGEWSAALRMADQFWLYLVAGCCGNRPQIQCIQNLSNLVYSGHGELLPIVYRLILRASL